MPTPLASLRLDARGLAAAAALALSAITLIATAGPAHASPGADAEATGEQFHFVLFASGTGSSSINGTTADLARANGLRRGTEALLYFRHHGDAYVIRDAATLGRAQTLFEPQRLLGQRQSALGRQQSALGRQQADLGRQQARVGGLQRDATIRQLEELGRQQAALGRQQSALGAQQAALGKQQGELGSEQARLGRIAGAKLRDLAAEALQRGLAQRVN